MQTIKHTITVLNIIASGIAFPSIDRSAARQSLSVGHVVIVATLKVMQICSESRGEKCSEKSESDQKEADEFGVHVYPFAVAS